MKTLRQLRETARRPRRLPPDKSKDAINVDCRMLQLHTDMSDDEKWRAIEQFARRLISIEEYDVFLFAVW